MRSRAAGRFVGVALSSALALLAGCASGSSRAGRSETPEAPLAAGPSVPSGGPIQAAALARQTGLELSDAGTSVLLSSGDLRARFFPGNEKVSLDGRMVSMGEPARRDATGLLIPAAGAEAVRKAAQDAGQRRAAVAMAAARPTPPMLPPLALAPSKPSSLKSVDIPVSRMSCGRGSPDASWTSFTGSERRWRYIVIHHSDDHEGCCAKYDRVHLQKGWENGCGYDFVVGNGTQSGDGEVEVGPRWTRQMVGAHAKTPDNRYNEQGVGIVLVGDFEHGGQPTARQYDALVHLTRWLMARYDISAEDVLRHGDCKSTACPGKNFPWNRFLGDVSGPVATPP